MLASTSVNAKENSPQPSLQSQYEQQVTDSLKNYLKTLKKSGYSSNTKNLLKRKPKQKAQAFCSIGMKLCQAQLKANKIMKLSLRVIHGMPQP